jgi:uncharacterized membrane-anchored protein YitT (DUF2179 family)
MNSNPLFMFKENLGVGYLINVVIIIIVGSTISALGYSLFQIPFNIVAGGIGGLSIILNHYSGITEGILYFIFNIPLLIIGFKNLGRWYFLIFTAISVVVFSLVTDVSVRYIVPLLIESPLTENMLLSTIYGGLIGGVGGGIVMRVGGSTGGTNVLAKLVHQKFGFPMSQSYLITDSLIIFASVLVFGWDVALHGLLCLFLNGLASDFVFEGPSVIKVATIITDKPEKVADLLMHELNRGVSSWEIKGLYTGEKHYMLYCAIYRSQIIMLKHLLSKADDKAFVVIGDGRQALGEGFIPIKKV